MKRMVHELVVPRVGEVYRNWMGGYVRIVRSEPDVIQFTNARCDSRHVASLNRVAWMTYISTADYVYAGTQADYVNTDTRAVIYGKKDRRIWRHLKNS